MKKKTRKRTLVLTLLLTILLSLLEPLLIIAGILPPIFSYSLGNIIFSLARFAVIAYVAFSRADEGPETAAVNGVALAFATISILCALGLVGTEYFGRPVLGVSASSQGSRFTLLLFIILENIIIGAFLAALVAWLTRRFKLSKRPSPR